MLIAITCLLEARNWKPSEESRVSAVLQKVVPSLEPLELSHKTACVFLVGSSRSLNVSSSLFELAIHPDVGEHYATSDLITRVTSSNSPTFLEVEAQICRSRVPVVIIYSEEWVSRNIGGILFLVNGFTCKPTNGAVLVIHFHSTETDAQLNLRSKWPQLSPVMKNVILL